MMITTMLFAALVANPVAETKWEAPSFRGKAFWPMFAKLSHNRPVGGKAGWDWGVDGGLGDIPLTQEYAVSISTHGANVGVAKYRIAQGKKDENGKRIYYEAIPENERITGAYTLRDLFGKDPAYGEFLYEDDWKTRRLWNPTETAPFFLNVGESRPWCCLDGLDRGDKEDFARWVKAHPNFLGFYAMGEIDSDSGNYRRAMWGTAQISKISGPIREDFEKRFGVWKDRYDYVEFLKKCWQTEVNFHFGCNRFWPLYCNNQGLAHLNAKLGAVGLQNEVSTSQGSPWTWSGAYTRGASRQWGLPFSWYCATFYRGFKRNDPPGCEPSTGDNKWPRDGVHTKKRPAWMGASLSITARQKYYGWLIGAAMIQDEPWTMLCSSATNGVPCPSPFAKVFNDVYVRSTKIARGAPLTPIALLTPLTETTSRGGYATAVKDEKGDDCDQFNIPAYLFTLTPVHEEIAKYPMCLERRRHGDEGCLFNSPFGEIWDVLTIDSGLATPKMVAALKHYPIAFLAGTYRKGELDTAALEEYVKAGGTLVLSCDYVEEGLVSSELAGVEFGESSSSSSSSRTDDKFHCSRRPSAISLRSIAPSTSTSLRLNNAYTLHRGIPASGTRVLYTDEHGTPAAWARDLGRGRVITTAARRSLPDNLNEKCQFDKQQFHEKRLTLLNGTAELTLLRTLLETAQNETIPVKVDGDIQWGVNEVKVKGEGEERNCSRSLLIWLINNKGVVKYIGEPDEVDRSKTARVALSMRNVKNPEAFVFRDADTGEVIDPAAIEVGPGDVRFITVGR